MVLTREWFRAGSLGRTVDLSVAIAVFVAFIPYLYISGDPRFWIHVPPLVMVIAAVSLPLAQVLRRAVPATFELHEDRAVHTWRFGWRTRVVVLDGSARVEAVREDFERPLSRDNLFGYLFASTNRNRILICRKWGWSEDDMERLWESFVQVVRDRGCKYMDEDLEWYLRG